MEEHTRHLALAVQKAAERENYLASRFSVYKKTKDIGDEEIARLLDCEIEAYFRLALCRLPYLEKGSFGDRVRHIAKFANASPVALAKIIKHAESVQAFNRPVSSEYRNLLLAARKRDESPSTDETDKED